MTTLLPAGCDQQGRFATRQDRYAENEWRDTVAITRNVIRPVRKPEEPLTFGGLLIALFIVAALAAAVSLGPWL